MGAIAPPSLKIVRLVPLLVLYRLILFLFSYINEKKKQFLALPIMKLWQCSFVFRQTKLYIA